MNGSSEPRRPNPEKYIFPDKQLIEAKVQLAVQAFQNGTFKSIKAAADYYHAPYHRSLSRLRGHPPVSQNGGRCTVLDEAGDKALHSAMQRLVLQGQRVTTRHLEQAANQILRERCEPGKEPRQVNDRWARRYLSRHRHLAKRSRADWAKLDLAPKHNSPNGQAESSKAGRRNSI